MQKTIYQIHKKYAPNEELLDLVWSHSRIVANIATQLIERKKHLDIDKNLVTAGSLLHDIGVYQIPYTRQDRIRWDRIEYVTHGIKGAAIVRSEGLPEVLARAIERHIGVGITKEQIIGHNLLLPIQDFLPETIEEKLIAYADLFHSKIPKFNTFEEIREKIKEYDKASEKRLRELKKLFGVPDVTIIEQSNIESPPAPRLRRV